MVSLSGDQVVFEKEWVIKTCHTDQGRFLTNIRKQDKWQNDFIQAIPILKTDRDASNRPRIKMPFMFSDTLMNEERENKLIAYLSDAFKKSTISEFDYVSWNKKVLDTAAKIPHKETKKKVLSLQSKCRDPFYYSSNYHGDLTLSNILFVKSHIFAVDFLSSFIHSPIHDLVKLRQSTYHLWEGREDTEGLDIRLEQMIDNDPILKQFYIPFQILNLARIFPYAKSEDIKDYLIREINDLL